MLLNTSLLLAVVPAHHELLHAGLLVVLLLGSGIVLLFGVVAARTPLCPALSRLKNRITKKTL